jgi:hypothetical protein
MKKILLASILASLATASFAQGAPTQKVPDVSPEQFPKVHEYALKRMVERNSIFLEEEKCVKAAFNMESMVKCHQSAQKSIGELQKSVQKDRDQRATQP